MTEPIIQVEGLGKRYTLGARGGDGARYRTLRETLSEAARNLFRRGTNGTHNHANAEDFWALKDVSFSVRPGEVVGIIGRNGAGKSTLLKILSRITEPTQGRVTLRGRVASLLEVGTGFHPELTGRENIFLNGAVLGMGRHEIRAKFDEIVAFAEVERFLDTPVKRYSSGMYVRLAFAVAAHLEPEILIVDEVLAVGDAEFQKKCLGKMESVAKGEGRTVIFVSHNMGAINLLCSEVILLQQGSLHLKGASAMITRQYFDLGGVASSKWERPASANPHAEGIFLLGVRVLVQDCLAPSHISTNQGFEVEVEFQAQADYRDAEIAVRFTNHEGIPVLTTANSDQFSEFQRISRGRHIYRVHIPEYLLATGTYFLLVAALAPGKVLFDSIDGQVQVTIQEFGPQAATTRDGRLGVVNPRLPWERTTSASSAIQANLPNARV